MNYYISDLHIGHENAIMYDGRPFADTNEMNNTIIANWNGRVQDDDTVYILGDFIWGKENEWQPIVEMLSGNKVCSAKLLYPPAQGWHTTVNYTTPSWFDACLFFRIEKSYR